MSESTSDSPFVGDLLSTHDIPGGAAWSVPVRAGRSLTLTALGPGACATTLIYAADRLDRLNVPDTLKAQMSARICVPMVLMSDRGRALACVVASSLDWHDALCGFTSAADLAGLPPTDYQHDRNDWRRSARQLLLLELYKHGMGEPDLHGSVNFFTKVSTRDDLSCSLHFQPGHAVTGDHLTLRAEQDLLVLIATTAHPLDPSFERSPAGVRAQVRTAMSAAGPDDPSMLFRPESARALDETRKALA